MTTERPSVSQTRPASTGEMREPRDLPSVPDDADDTRGVHLRQLLVHPATLIITGVLAALALVVVGAQVGFGIGAAAAGGILLIACVVVWLIATSKAAADFFDAYAQGRGLTRIDGKSSLPAVTPLLRKGKRRYAEQRFNGVLPGGLEGSLCLYTYEDESTDSDGDSQTTYIHYTIVMTELPDTARLLHELYCQRRFGFRFMDGMEDSFRRRQRVEQESAEVDRKYEIFIGKDDDMAMARQVLSPSFLVWLEEHSPDAYAFELCAGSLVCNVKGHKKSASELDRICQAAAAVARRLQEEASETVASA